MRGCVHIQNLACLSLRNEISMNNFHETTVNFTQHVEADYVFIHLKLYTKNFLEFTPTDEFSIIVWRNGLKFHRPSA